MSQPLTPTQLNDAKESLPWDYRDYEAWLDKDVDEEARVGGQCWCICSVPLATNINHETPLPNTCDDQWNVLKAAISSDEFPKAQRYIVQHEFKPAKWFPEFIAKDVELSQQLLQALEPTVAHIDVGTFDGGFVLNGDSLLPFITAFRSYPTTYNYRNIDIYSWEFPLVIKIDHHLCIEFICGGMHLMASITRVFDSCEIKYIRGEGFGN